jgi:hypothetical protein
MLLAMFLFVQQAAIITVSQALASIGLMRDPAVVLNGPAHFHGAWPAMSMYTPTRMASGTYTTPWMHTTTTMMWMAQATRPSGALAIRRPSSRR